MQAIHKSLELDEKNCGAHWTLAHLTWRYDWDWERTEKELRYAIELCPNTAAARWQLAFYLAWSGRLAEGLAESAKARDLDPRRLDRFERRACWIITLATTKRSLT